MPHSLSNLVRSAFSKRDTERLTAPACSSFEGLESRLLLSGDVSALIVDGSLRMRGDAAANSVVLDQIGLTGHQVRITGAGGTQINGQAAPVVLSGVLRRLFIRMGGGADSVTLNNMSLPGNLAVVQTGDNSVALSVNSVKVARSLYIKNSSRLRTRTLIANSAIGNMFMMQTGSGGQSISLQSVSVRRETSIVTGKGTDTVAVDDSTFRGAVRMDTGAGTDLVQVDGRGAAAGPTTQFKGAFAISMGSGNDTLQFGVSGQAGKKVVFSDRVFLDGGSGFDLLHNFNDTHARKLRVVNFESATSTLDTTPPTVSSTTPLDHATGVFLNRTVAPTFSEAMNESTLTKANFTVAKPSGAVVAGSVAYDSASHTETFTPSSNLAPSTTYTVTIAGGVNGVRDLAGNPLAVDKVWTFQTGTQIAQATIPLGAAGTFALMATASITGTGPSQITGDVGLSPGTSQGIDPSQINGSIDINDQAIQTAQAALLHAYNDAISRAVTSQALPGNMGGLTFTPGLYTNSTSVLIQGVGSDNFVTLDAQGDANAIFIFKMGSTLTAATGSQVILAGGAKAGNIFWQIGSSATINAGSIFKGNLLAAVTITVNSGSAVEGRLLAGSTGGAGSVTVNASRVTVPST